MSELKRSCFRYCTAWVAGFLACASLTLALLLGNAAGWLSKADTPRRVDAIVVLGGSFERTLYAAELYASGNAPRIYLSNPARDASLRMLDDLGITIPTEREISAAILKRKGVAEKDVLRLPGTMLSTADEAESLGRVFAGQRLAIMVVTSPYHIRRARMIFEKALAGTQLKAFFIATPHERYRTDWWNDQDSARNTILELAKIIFYLAGGGFRSPTAIPVSP